MISAYLASELDGVPEGLPGDEARRLPVDAVPGRRDRGRAPHPHGDVVVGRLGQAGRAHVQPRVPPVHGEQAQLPPRLVQLQSRVWQRKC